MWLLVFSPHPTSWILANISSAAVVDRLLASWWLMVTLIFFFMLLYDEYMINMNIIWLTYIKITMVIWCYIYVRWLMVVHKVTYNVTIRLGNNSDWGGLTKRRPSLAPKAFARVLRTRTATSSNATKATPRRQKRRMSRRHGVCHGKLKKWWWISLVYTCL